MFPSFRYSLVFVFFLLGVTPSVPTRTIPSLFTQNLVTETNTWRNIAAFLSYWRGSHVRGAISDRWMLEGAKRYVHYPGKPRWVRPKTPMTLTYAFSLDNMITSPSLSDIRRVFKGAFAKWATVIPVSFNETEDYITADIKIGFYTGDHRDGRPFDGVLGSLAHSFSPEGGQLHLDAAEKWTVDFRAEESEVAVDLESVAVHEIGHVLGLGHSLVEGAVMFSGLEPRDKKVDLHRDDVEGVQALYGANPNFKVGDLSVSDTTRPPNWQP